MSAHGHKLQMNVMMPKDDHLCSRLAQTAAGLVQTTAQLKVTPSCPWNIAKWIAKITAHEGTRNPQSLQSTLTKTIALSNRPGGLA